MLLAGEKARNRKKADRQKTETRVMGERREKRKADVMERAKA